MAATPQNRLRFMAQLRNFEDYADQLYAIADFIDSIESQMKLMNRVMAATPHVGGSSPAAELSTELDTQRQRLDRLEHATMRKAEAEMYIMQLLESWGIQPRK